MIPTGFEFNCLSDKPPIIVLRKLLENLILEWNDIWVQVALDWQTLSLREWLSVNNDLPKDLEIYFSSDCQGFDYIEENGIVPNPFEYKYFMLEIITEQPVNYMATILGNVNSDNTRFGEFSCEILLEKLFRYTVITPDDPSKERESKKIISAVRASVGSLLST
jgi:hypothetical protein